MDLKSLTYDELNILREQVENEFNERIPPKTQYNPSKDFDKLENDEDVIALAKIFKKYFYELKTKVDSEITLKISGSILDSVQVSESDSGGINVVIHEDDFGVHKTKIQILGTANESLKYKLSECVDPYIEKLVLPKYYQDKLKELKLMLKEKKVLESIVVLANDYEASIQDIIDAIYATTMTNHNRR